jgi:hypothetical protein
MRRLLEVATSSIELEAESEQAPPKSAAAVPQVGHAHIQRSYVRA